MPVQTNKYLSSCLVYSIIQDTILLFKFDYRIRCIYSVCIRMITCISGRDILELIQWSSNINFFNENLPKPQIIIFQPNEFSADLKLLNKKKIDPQPQVNILFFFLQKIYPGTRTNSFDELRTCFTQKLIKDRSEPEQGTLANYIYIYHLLKMFLIQPRKISDEFLC